MSADKPRKYPSPREIAPFVRVELNPPPCERRFALWYAPDGNLDQLETDGQWFKVRPMKRSGRCHPGTRCLPLVDVQVRLPNE